MGSSYSAGDIIARRYRVLLHHAGGMGIVYVCKDMLADERKIVLKTMKDEYLLRHSSTQEFINECRVWISLGYHDHIVTALRLEMIDQRPYLVLDYGGAWNLRSWMGEGLLTYDHAMDISIKVASGMAYAQHAVPSLVHRDLKPENILIKDWLSVSLDTEYLIANRQRIIRAVGNDPDNPNLAALSELSGKPIEHKITNVKVTDFGLARVVHNFDLPDSAKPDSFSIRAEIAGTPRYMSPEQCRGDSVDRRSDAYSFGMIMYEMFTGKWPYAQVYGRAAALVAHISAEAEPIDRVAARPVGALGALIMSCLEKDPDCRPQTFQEILDRLNEFKGEGSNAEKIHTIYNISLPPPTPREIKLRKSLALIELGDVDQGVAMADEAINELTNEDEKIEFLCSIAEALRNVAQARRNARWLDIGMSFCERALEVNSNDTSALREKGIMLALASRGEDAVRVYDHIISLTPDVAQIHVNKGAILCDYLGRYQEAIRCFDQAIALDPDVLETWTNKGVALGRVGQYEEALDALESALKLDPNSTSVLQVMGAILNDRVNRPAEALMKFDRIIEVNPTLASAWHSRGVALRDLGRDMEALHAFARAYSLDQGFIGSLANMGEIYMRRGEYAEARRYLTVVVRANPSDDRAQAELRTCEMRLNGR
jgi:eukaryotic-like serine/threonine-protein kinase